MTTLWRFLRRSLWLGLIIGLGVLSYMAFRHVREARDSAPVTVVHRPSGPRVWYPDDRYPQMRLPDGRSETIRSVLNVTRRMHYGQYVWNDDHIPAGEVWAYADLTRQTLSVFRAGHEIGSAVILYGTDGKPTPTGTFRILARAKDHQSSLYDAKMPYMLRLTGDGVAIHASHVRKGVATHGCIGVPIAFARLLYDQMQIGDRVTILRTPGPPDPTARLTRH